MTWSKERKRQERKERRKKKEQDLLRTAQCQREMILRSPPITSLKRPTNPQHLGKPSKDYGGHALTLNFPTKGEAYNDRRIGDIALGLAYSSDYKHSHPLIVVESMD